MNSGAEVPNWFLSIRKLFLPNTRQAVFLNLLDALISKIPFSLFAEFWVRVASGAPGVSLGRFLGGGGGGWGGGGGGGGGLHRLLSYTPHNAGLSQRWITYISHDMPCSKTTVRSKLGQWLRVHATWDDNRYASWHIPHSGPHTDWCGDWSTCSGASMSPQSGGGGRGPI